MTTPSHYRMAFKRLWPIGNIAFKLKPVLQFQFVLLNLQSHFKRNVSQLNETQTSFSHLLKVHLNYIGLVSDRFPRNVYFAFVRTNHEMDPILINVCTIKSIRIWSIRHRMDRMVRSYSRAILAYAWNTLRS